MEYHHDILRGAKRRANELGFGFTMKWINPLKPDRSGLERVLLHQNVEGIVLLPMAGPSSCEDWLSWEKFSVVSATYGVLAPHFHRVVPHQFSNVRMACSQLTALGYRRIGMIINAEHSLVVNHAFVAALATHYTLGPAQVVSPLLYEGELSNLIKAWFDRERPDSLIFEGEATCRIVEQTLKLHRWGEMGIALSNRERNSELAGIDEQGEDVGRTAVEVLAFKIQIGHKGVPAQSLVTMIEGTWIPEKVPRRSLSLSS